MPICDADSGSSWHLQCWRPVSVCQWSSDFRAFAVMDTWSLWVMTQVCGPRHCVQDLEGSFGLCFWLSTAPGIACIWGVNHWKENQSISTFFYHCVFPTNKSEDIKIHLCVNYPRRCLQILNILSPQEFLPTE